MHRVSDEHKALQRACTHIAVFQGITRTWPTQMTPSSNPSGLAARPALTHLAVAKPPLVTPPFLLLRGPRALRFFPAAPAAWLLHLITPRGFLVVLLPCPAALGRLPRPLAGLGDLSRLGEDAALLSSSAKEL